MRICEVQAVYAALAAVGIATPLAAGLPVLESRDASDPLAWCPGYKASNIRTSAVGMTADLTLAGDACNVFGTDLENLTLSVEYQTCGHPCTRMPH
jgi:alpha-glucosidase